MDKYTVDLDQVLNDFEYNELTTEQQYNQQQQQQNNSTKFNNNNNNNSNKNATTSNAFYINKNKVVKHSINNVFHSLNEYLNSDITPKTKTTNLLKTTPTTTATINNNKNNNYYHNINNNNSIKEEPIIKKTDKIDEDESQNNNNNDNNNVSEEIFNNEEIRLIVSDFLINEKNELFSDNKKAILNDSDKVTTTTNTSNNSNNNKNEEIKDDNSRDGDKCTEEREISLDEDHEEEIVEEIPQNNEEIEINKPIGFDEDIDIDENELNQYLNDLENEYNKEIEKVEIPIRINDELLEISRPNNLPLNNQNSDSSDKNDNRKIDLIGNPGSTPYNNVYIGNELSNSNSDIISSDRSSTTSESPTFSDMSTETTSSLSPTGEPADELATITTTTTTTTTPSIEMTKNDEIEDETEQQQNNDNEEQQQQQQQINEEEQPPDDEAIVNISNNNNNPDTNWLGKQAPLWIPDADSLFCLHCNMKFTVIKRRHHCRACGLVLCSKCCNLRLYLDYMEAEARVCFKCFDIIGIQQNPTTITTTITTTTTTTNSDNTNDDSVTMMNKPNPNNPLEYCSTIPPHQQVISTTNTSPTVMVPVGVLKRKGSNKSRSGKSVIFCDGIRPGSDLTNLDHDFTYKNNVGNSDNNNDTTKSLIYLNNNNQQKYPHYYQETKSFIPNNCGNTGDLNNNLPPIVTFDKNDLLFTTECKNDHELIEKLKNEIITFALQLNVFVQVKIINLDCCINKLVWCFTTDGLINVGQDEIIILLEISILDDTSTNELLPTDIFIHLNNLYLDSLKGNTVKELGISLHNTTNFLNSKNHSGFIYIRPTFQCLQNIIKPKNKEPYLIGLLIHKWETPWAKLFPLRLILRLGAEYRYYPTPIISTRYRNSVYVDIGHTIINLLADFRNFSYTLPQIRGLTIHMEDKNTIISIPINRYDQIIKSINNSSDHILAFAGNFSTTADSHLVCIQDTQSNDNSYSTHAINILNKTRKVTGASFIVFNGALKSTSGLTAKSSIVEDGLMIQISSDCMIEIREHLRNMKNYKIHCGCISNNNITVTNNQIDENEIVNIIWGDNDCNFNVDVVSPIDGKKMTGIPSIRVHNGKDYLNYNRNRFIRWCEVFIIQNGDETSGGSGRNQEPIDLSKISENIAIATCNALVKYLDLLIRNNFYKIGIRTTLHIDNVSYLAGSNLMILPPIYMKHLDNELIPVLHRITTNNNFIDNNVIILELIFRILNN